MDFIKEITQPHWKKTRENTKMSQKFLFRSNYKIVISGDVCLPILSASELFIILQLVLNVRDNLVTIPTAPIITTFYSCTESKQNGNSGKKFIEDP